jgi:hypothetical protein
MKALRIDAWLYKVGMAVSALVVAVAYLVTGAFMLAGLAFVAIWAIELI